MNVEEKTAHFCHYLTDIIQAGFNNKTIQNGTHLKGKTAIPLIWSAVYIYYGVYIFSK